MSNKTKNPTGQNIIVNSNLCIGCGVCISLAPENFKLNDEGKCEIISNKIDEKTEDAKNSCPVAAIKFV